MTRKMGTGVDRKPKAGWSLQEVLVETFRGFRADRGLDYGRVMAVMGELNRAGCNSISLVTNGSSQAP